MTWSRASHDLVERRTRVERRRTEPAWEILRQASSWYNYCKCLAERERLLSGKPPPAPNTSPRELEAHTCNNRPNRTCRFQSDGPLQLYQETDKRGITIIMRATATLAAGGILAGAVGIMAYLRLLKSTKSAQSRRVIVAVSGTIQDGFELRKNIDYADGEECVEAVLLGYAVVRGVKMYFDVKDVGCREYDANTPHRVNPAMVLTGNRLDANQYALYLVDERACLVALLGEPRLLTMCPDALRIDLTDHQTSPDVAALARAIIARDGKTETDTCAVLCVVPCYLPRHFVAAPIIERRLDGTKLTSFRASLAAFAELPQSAEPGTVGWNDAVADALAKAREKISPTKMRPSNEIPGFLPTDDSLYGTTPAMARLSRRMTPGEFNALAVEAGIEARA